jgi:site-specific DNA recombinase
VPSAPTTLIPAATAPVAQTTKRAFAYLRVSSESQVNTGFTRDGLSIDAQREHAETKAQQLDAEIMRFFLDPGKSAYVDLHKRTDFLEMLAELKRRNEHAASRIDYVIIWATDRWARNTVDHFQTHDLVKAAGARLVSITEPMIGEGTPESFYFEGMQAVNNQYESMKTSRRVKGGIYQKAKVGGSYGLARLGYINDVESLPDGHRVAAVSLDPDRHDFITMAFQLYATGEYSLSQLSHELFRLGLLSRSRRDRTPKKVQASTLQRVLRDPYYLGLVPYKRGTPDEEIFDGRHQRLTDQATFDRVQAQLDEKRLAGERPQKHQHYLRGSVYCGECGRRMVYGLSRSKNGTRHAYYFCIGRMQRSGCAMSASVRPQLIETAIQLYYRERPVQLTRKDIAKRTEAIEALVAVSQEAVGQVKAAKAQLIRSLEARQDALVDMRFKEKSISTAVFKRKQATLEAEIDAAQTSLAETETTLQLDAAMLRMALELAENVAEVYASANERTKRGYNQAFFKKLYVTPEWDDDQGQKVVRITDEKLTEPYAALLAESLAPNLLAEIAAIQAAKTGDDSGESSPVGLGSNFINMVGETGFEPATARPPAGCATRLRHSPWPNKAGDGNRTRPRSLEGFCATTTLRPQPCSSCYRRAPPTRRRPRRDSAKP